MHRYALTAHIDAHREMSDWKKDIEEFMEQMRDALEKLVDKHAQSRDQQAPPDDGVDIRHLMPCTCGNEPHFDLRLDADWGTPHRVMELKIYCSKCDAGRISINRAPVPSGTSEEDEERIRDSIIARGVKEWNEVCLHPDYQAPPLFRSYMDSRT